MRTILCIGILSIVAQIHGVELYVASDELEVKDSNSSYLAFPGETPVLTGVSRLGANRYQIGSVQFDAAARTLTIPAVVNMLDQVVEYVLVHEGGKTHESVFSTKASPVDIHMAALLLGVKATNAVANADGSIEFPPANMVEIRVKWPRNGPDANHPITKTVVTRKSIGSDAWYNPPDDSNTIGETTVLPEQRWFYCGSKFVGNKFMALAEGSIIAVIADPASLVMNSDPTSYQRRFQHYPNKDLLLKVGSAVSIVFRFSDLPDMSDLRDRPDLGDLKE